MRLLGSIRFAEFNPVAHEQDCTRVLPDDLKPFRLGARVQQCNAVAVLGQFENPAGNFITIEWRVFVNEEVAIAQPVALEATACLIDTRNVPRPRVGRARIQPNRLKRVRDPLR